MGLLNAATLAEFQKGKGSEVYLALDLSLPGGTKRYAFGGIPSSLGQYEGRLIRFGPPSYGLALKAGSLETVECGASIDDGTRTFAKLIRGTTAGSVKNSAAVVKLISPNLGPSDWFPIFTGRLVGWSQDTPLEWNLLMRPDELPLKADVPKTLITRSDFPNAKAAALGQVMPILYGVHNSQGAGDTGMVPCPYLDTVGFRYGVQYAWAKAVDRVYADGTLVTTGFSVTNPLINGRRYTLIDFTTDQLAKVITADVQGIETVGDGTGTLITDASDQLAHFLENFVYGDYQSGAYPTPGTSAPIDTTAFAAAKTFLSDRGYKGSKRMADAPAEARGYLGEWFATVELKAHWTMSGKIGIAILNPMLTGIYTESGWLRHDRDDLGWGGYTQQSDLARDRITGSFIFGATAGQYLQTLEVRDPSITEQAPESLDLPWSHAALS